MPTETQRKPSLTDEQILSDIKVKTAVPIWPHGAWAHGVCRGKAYEMARDGLAKGSPEFLRDGKMIRVLTGPLRRKLQIEG